MHKGKTRKLQARAMRRSDQGFTLIEIMIVVVIISILAAIAVPSYNEYARRSARTLGQNYLAELAQRQELFFQNNRAYATTAEQLGFLMPPEVSQRYDSTSLAIVVNAGPPASFTITITPLTTGLLASEGVVTITSTGLRTWVDKNSNIKRWDER